MKKMVAVAMMVLALAGGSQVRADAAAEAAAAEKAKVEAVARAAVTAKAAAEAAAKAAAEEAKALAEVQGLVGANQWAKALPKIDAFVSAYPKSAQTPALIQTKARGLQVSGKNGEALKILDELYADGRPMDVPTMQVYATGLMMARRIPDAAALALAQMLAAMDAAAMRQWRDRLNAAAVLIEKVELRAAGKSIIGPNALVRTAALVQAENIGKGLQEAVAAFGWKLPAGWDEARATVERSKADILAGWLEPSPQFLCRLELFEGVDGAKAFEKAYNVE